MKERLRRALDWLGFTPTQRESHLQRLLDGEHQVATDERIRVARVVVLLHYRESVGATSIDVASIREALYGEEEPR